MIGLRRQRRSPNAYSVASTRVVDKSAKPIQCTGINRNSARSNSATVTMLPMRIVIRGIPSSALTTCDPDHPVGIGSVCLTVYADRWSRHLSVQFRFVVRAVSEFPFCGARKAEQANRVARLFSPLPRGVVFIDCHPARLRGIHCGACRREVGLRRDGAQLLQLRYR